MKRLLMLSYPFPPNASAGAVRSERFARFLPGFGWEVEVVTICPQDDSVDKWISSQAVEQKYRVQRTNTLDPWLFYRDRIYRSPVLRIWRSLIMRLFSFPDHMLLWSLFAAKAGFACNKKESVDAVYTTSPPHSTHLAGMLISQRSGIPWIADFRDPWTLNAYRGCSQSDFAMLAFERIMEKAVLRRADVILANTTANRTNLLKNFPFLPFQKVVHLPNGWEEFPDNIPGPAFNGRFLIVHAGTFYPRFKPYAMLNAVSLWRKGLWPAGPAFPQDGIEIRLLGSNDGTTKKIISELNLKDIVVTEPWVPLNAARSAMKQADILWASLGTGKESATYIPSKLFEYITAQRPIFGFFPEGEAANLIRDTNTGRVFTSDDPEPIIEALNQAIIMKNSKKTDYFPCESSVRRYHIRSIVCSLANILDNLTGEK